MLKDTLGQGHLHLGKLFSNEKNQSVFTELKAFCFIHNVYVVLFITFPVNSPPLKFHIYIYKSNISKYNNLTIDF